MIVIVDKRCRGYWRAVLAQERDGTPIPAPLRKHLAAQVARHRAELDRIERAIRGSEIADAVCGLCNDNPCRCRDLNLR